jgi:hypothetical protein
MSMEKSSFAAKNRGGPFIVTCKSDSAALEEVADAATGTCSRHAGGCTLCRKAGESEKLVFHQSKDTRR